MSERGGREGDEEIIITYSVCSNWRIGELRDEDRW